MEDRLVTIAQYETGFEAELAKVRLESEGISAAALGGDLVAYMYTLPAVKVQVQVFEKDAARARQILEADPTPPQQEPEQQQ